MNALLDSWVLLVFGHTSECLPSHTVALWIVLAMTWAAALGAAARTRDADYIGVAGIAVVVPIFGPVAILCAPFLAAGAGAFWLGHRIPALVEARRERRRERARQLAAAEQEVEEVLR